MKYVIVAAVAALSFTGCSSMDGQFGKEVHEFDDEQGRHCTALKWGESASIDCDYPEDSK